MRVLLTLGISDTQAHEFLHLVSADVNELRYYDLQYRPFLRIAPNKVWNGKEIISTLPEIIHLPGPVALSNIIPNVQHANRLGLDSNASSFVDVVANMFRTRFNRVAVNRRLQKGSKVTDADIVLFENSTLYILECKYSVPPNDPHELRDAWEAIERAADQLELAIDILKDGSVRQSYLAGWFPGTSQRDTEDLRLVPCILSSHRTFSGIEYAGIPVRDFSSLSSLFGSGIIRNGYVDETGRTLIYRHRMISEDGISIADFDDYVGTNSKYFAIHAPFMHSVTRLEAFARKSGVLASESYVLGYVTDEILQHLDSLGFDRLSNEKHTVSLPESVEEVKKRLSRENVDQTDLE